MNRSTIGTQQQHSSSNEVATKERLRRQPQEEEEENEYQSHNERDDDNRFDEELGIPNTRNDITGTDHHHHRQQQQQQHHSRIPVGLSSSSSVVFDDGAIDRTTEMKRTSRTTNPTNASSAVSAVEGTSTTGGGSGGGGCTVVLDDTSSCRRSSSIRHRITKGIINTGMGLTSSCPIASSTSSSTGGGGGGGGGPTTRSVTSSTTAAGSLSGDVQRSVRVWRGVVIIVLVGCMIGTAIAVHTYTSRTEQRKFYSDYTNTADKIIEAVAKSLDFTLCSIDAMVASIVSFTMYTNQTWPFVSIHHFPIRAGKIQTLSNAISLNLYPFVTIENRKKWEYYTATHNDWVEQSITMQQYDPSFHGPILTNYSYVNVIFDEDAVEDALLANHNESNTLANYINGTTRTEPPFYLPVWQHAPVVTNPPYNMDMLSISNRTDQQHRSVQALYAVLDSHQVIISEPTFNEPLALLMNQYDDTTTTVNNRTTNWMNKKPSTTTTVDPTSDIHFPIFTQMDTNITTNNITQPNNEFVGLLSLTVYWKSMLYDILPDDSFGIRVVFHNPCNPTFTYQIDGPDVTYLGQGDHHDPNFDSMVVESIVVTNTNNTNSTTTTNWSGSQRSSASSRLYNGVPINTSYCPMTIRVYPSQEMQDHYTTQHPLVITMGVVFIFAFTSCVFLMYNYWVERRQRQVMECAIESMINASELDKIVQERTVALQQTNSQLEQANSRIHQASLQQLEHFACMSHEIRTPLNGINGLSSVVRNDLQRIKKLQSSNNNNNCDEPPSRQAWDIVQDVVNSSFEAIDMIVSSGELLRTIVDDVLDFAKLGSGKVDVTITPNASLQEIFDTVIRSIESNGVVTSKQLTIQTLYGTTVQPYYTTDSRRLQQILYNLLGNAVKFSRYQGIVEFHVLYHTIPTPARTAATSTGGAGVDFTGWDTIHFYDGTIGDATDPTKTSKIATPSHSLFDTNGHHHHHHEVTTTTTSAPTTADEEFGFLLPPPPIPTTDKSNTVLRFIIKDYGRGIQRDKFNAIFEPFIQAEGASTEIKHGGTGLGLAITSRLVEALGGTITVDSVFGEWTEFIVDFPLEPTTSITTTTIPDASPHTETPTMPRQRRSMRAPVSLSDPILQNQLQSIQLYLVDDNSMDRGQMEGVFRYYNLKYVSRNSITELQELFQKQQPSNDSTTTAATRGDEWVVPDSAIHNIILIRDDLWEEDSNLARNHQPPAKVITFGSKYDSQEALTASSHEHFRRLARMLPTILLQNLLDITDLRSGKSSRLLTKSSSEDPIMNDTIRNLRILIAEDNKINQKVLLRILDRLGITNVTVVANGRDAVEKEAFEPYDVVLMDMHMPIMDGMVACKEILRRTRTAAANDENNIRGSHPIAKIIFLTAHVTEAFKKDCYEAGAVGFLPKPCSLRRIAECLSNLAIHHHKNNSDSNTTEQST